MDTYQKYLKQSLKQHPLDPHQVRWIFLKTLDDYFHKRVDEQTVESVATELHWMAGGESQLAVMRFDRELDTMFDLAAEFTSCGDQNDTANQLHNYYLKHRSLLTALPDTCCEPSGIPLADKDI